MVKIEQSWKEILKDEFPKKYFEDIKIHIQSDIKQLYTVYPKGSQIFNAFEKTPFSKLKVVIIGQDPYHNPNQAMGLCFSVPENTPLPPSLQNIFKELYNDIGIIIPKSGDLTKWATEGVLLLNAILTVRKNEPASHSKIGWQTFTDVVIQQISEKANGIVFLLWGKYAQEKTKYIDQSKHFILTAAHPSPLSAFNGFFGCKHFSRTNEILSKQGKQPINWKL